ncbi:pentatricopeptide repeat-containing protein At3g49170, chloroplastic-like [Selaginella moellendorffii]|uniref:pentatricopeptide repeat-containing protein At3g49170, chloroplastic-like n=1 Tax=Selaginella moellendorffii TaxID=88036 RepID=UPI000D1C33C7|nr:pentatricopeptide repeat-containing protein At3g49170, chloroplastic-like [Selaginella moellendorffii]|eukprot:XP_024524782.1 pentatricopeptide repeat-containing protein At3g49170, chloroplastic-like [Selaginella moellendorffii]
MALRRGVKQSRECVEQHWLSFFEDPELWWDNRSKNWGNYPDFKHSSTGVGLWIGSCPAWLQPKIKCLEDATNGGTRRAHYKKDDHSIGTNSHSPLTRATTTRQPLTYLAFPEKLLADLKSCNDLEGGRELEKSAASQGQDASVYVAAALVSMYARCGSLIDARRVFEARETRDTRTWNALLLGYVNNGMGVAALELFERMVSDGCAPDSRTFVAAAKACGISAAAELAEQQQQQGFKAAIKAKKSLETGVAIHGQARTKGFDTDIYVANTLVGMYAKCGDMAAARDVFDSIQQPSVVSWNALLLGCVENGEAELALQLYEEMVIGAEAPPPSAETYVAALKACVALGAEERCLKVGRSIYSLALASGCMSNLYVKSTMIDMYARCGSLEDAKKVFDSSPQHNAVTWNALLFGYVENGRAQGALELFARMKSSTKDGARCAPTSRTYLAAVMACAALAAQEEATEVEIGRFARLQSLERGRALHREAVKVVGADLDSSVLFSSALVDMYAKCGSMVDARRVFDSVAPAKRDVVLWTGLIRGYVNSGESERALELYSRMAGDQGSHAGISPSPQTYGALLKACGSVNALEAGEQIHAQIVGLLDKNPILVTCLIDFYGKTGRMAAARKVFDQWISVTKHDIAAWNAVIAGYSLQGDALAVFEMLERMEEEDGLEPNGVTFVSVLSACSHAGLVEEARKYFAAMSNKHGISPGREHYVCMVDLLGRANRFGEAVNVIESMPMKPDAIIWKTLLGACRKWKNVAVGEVAFESLVELDASSAAAYVLMANIYSSTGKLDERSKVLARRNVAKAWRKPGKSWWTDSSGRVHSFLVGNTTHEQIGEIRAKLEELVARMKENGYAADVESVLKDVSDGEKEDALCQHSEKLAVACALINSKPGSVVRIAKNLRVCQDCHKATAIISKLEEREIVCRDASRLHIFKGGQCSCGDYL